MPRLAVVLRSMLSRIVLTTTETGRGRATQARGVTVVWRADGEEDGFTVAPDLRSVYTVEGEEVVRMRA